VNTSSWKTVTYKKIKVSYLPTIEGGGREFGQDYIPVVTKLFSKGGTVCEFGCGPGFIGFSLLANGLCNRLCLVDIDPQAIEACRETIRKNKLQGKVTTYISDGLKDVPMKEKWDLVVSNPPHFDGKFTGNTGDSLVIDPGWKIHKRFYGNVAKHLHKKGSVLFVENLHGSNEDTFKTMINKGGLTFIKTFQYAPRLSDVIWENLQVLLSRLTVDKLKNIPKFLRRMSVKPSTVIALHKYPFYFIWSKKI
jgi:predicted RNA methylase